MMAWRARSASAVVLAACGALLPPLAVWAPLGLAPLLAIAAVAVLFVDGRAAIAAAARLAPLALLLAALAVWAMASAAWSILPRHSLFEGLRLVLIAAGGLIVVGAGMALPPELRGRVRAAMVAGVVLAIALLLFERVTHGALTRFFLGVRHVTVLRFDRGATTLALASWPAAVAAPHRRLVARIALAFASAVAVFAMASSAAALAVIVAWLVFTVARAAPKLAALALIGGLAAIQVGLPLAVPSYRGTVALHEAAPWIKFSGIHRLLIWRFTSERIAERPILGWGMDASRALPGGKTDLSILLPKAGLTPDSQALPLHPHNAALQWQVELGIPGSVLAFALLAWCLWRVGSRAALTPFARAAALAWAATALVIGLLDFGIWQAWWLACLWLTASFLAAADPPLMRAGAETPRGSGDIRARDRP